MSILYISMHSDKYSLILAFQPMLPTVFTHCNYISNGKISTKDAVIQWKMGESFWCLGEWGGLYNINKKRKETRGKMNGTKVLNWF